MNSADTLTDAFERIRESVYEAVDGLEPDALDYRPDTEANSISWLVWHLTRVQDEHLAELTGGESFWTERGWYERFDLSLDRDDTGYGHTPAEVARVRASADLLLGYYDAVHDHTVRFVAALTDSDLDRMVDETWNPPVTMGVRLISVIADDLQHAGQAAYLRGLHARATETATVR